MNDQKQVQNILFGILKHNFLRQGRNLLLLSGIFFFLHCWYHPSEMFDYRHSVYVDEFKPDQDMSFPEIQQYENFQPGRSDKDFHLKGNRKPLWLKMKISDLDASRYEKGKGKYFEFQSSYLASIQIYFPVVQDDKTIAYTLKQSGKDFPIQEREFNFRNFIIQIPDNVSRTEYTYICLKSDLSITFQILMHTKDFFERRLRIDNYYFGIIYGVLLAMLIYNVFVYYALRSRTYLYYIIHVISVIIFISNLYGQLWTVFESLQMHHLKILWLSGSSVIVFSCLFVRKFLSIEKFSPKFYRLMHVIVFLGAVLFLAGLFEFYAIANIIARTLAVFIPFVYVGAGILSTKKGLKSARLLFVSWSIIAVAFIGIATKGLSLPLLDIVSLVSLPAAFAIESMLYSVALANKLRDLYNEKEEAIRYGKRFEEMSYTDPLTGFYNRRYFESKLQAEILHAKLMDRPLGLILLDMDNFKMINDTYGHGQGDAVLREISKLLLDNKRREDTLCRYGGEEFACILPGSDLQSSSHIAEKMRKKCESIIFSPKPFTHFKVTVSAGVTTFYPEDTDDSLIERADRLMYRAKRSGKNTVISD